MASGLPACSANPQARAASSDQLIEGGAIDLAALRDGDLVFRRGRDLTSRLVLSQSEQASYSHVGMVVIRDGAPWVIHAMPEEDGDPGGVLLEEWAAFASPENAAMLGVRHPVLNEGQRMSARAHAFAQVGKPFDDDFALSTPDSIYCTELAVDALGAALGRDGAQIVSGTPITLFEEPVVLPDDLLAWSGLAPVED